MKNYHLCVSVRGALRKPLSQLKGMMIDDKGRSLSGAEVRDALMEELAQGHEKISIGDCDNFDYKKGCQGHEQKEKIEPVKELIKKYEYIP